MKLNLFLSNQELTAIVTEGRRTLSVTQHRLPLTKEALTEFLAQFPAGSRAAIVMDVVEEERSSERVAKVMPWEQQALLQRKIARSKGRDTLVHSHWLGKEASEAGRSELLAQVISISFDDNFKLLSAALLEQDIVVEHVYSLSQLVFEALQKRFKSDKNKLKRTWSVCVQTAALCYRQILLVDGHAVLSRSIVLDHVDPQRLREEQLSFERFVMVKRLVPYGHQFDYILIGKDQQELDELVQSCGTLNPDTQIETVQISSLLKEHTPDFLAQRWLAQWAGCYKPKTHFVHKPFQTGTKHRSLSRTLSLVMLLAVVISAQQLIDFAVSVHSSQQLVVEMEGKQQDYQRHALALEQEVRLPARADDIKESTRFVERMQQQGGGQAMLDTLLLLSQVLTNYSELQLQTLAWQADNPFTAERQSLRLLFSLNPNGQQLADIPKRLDKFTAELANLTWVENAERDAIPVDTDVSKELVVKRDEESQTRYNFEVRLEVVSEN